MKGQGGRREKQEGGSRRKGRWRRVKEKERDGAIKEDGDERERTKRENKRVMEVFSFYL